MNREEFIEMGFKPLNHFTVADNLIYDLGRNRQLSAGSVSTPNEVIFICEIDENNPMEITDLLCIHNYDYDGLMTPEKLTKLLEVLS